MRKKDQPAQVSQISPVVKVEGLKQFEIAVLVSVAQQVNNPHDGITAYEIHSDMEKAGFKRIAATLGIKTLLDKEMLETVENYDEQFDCSFTSYRVAERGMACLLANTHMLTLRVDDNDDDVPF
jgi:hypothetical protein